MLSEEEKREIRKQFGALANMPPGKLERWLAAQASRQARANGDGTNHDGAGANGGDGDGHGVDLRAGRRIVELKRTKMDDLLEQDYAQMQEIVRYLERRLARRPEGDLTDSEWRRTLMSWGHDPLA